MQKISTFTLSETRFLSNFYPHKKDGSRFCHSVQVIYNDICFDCTENAYQAAKTTDKNLQKQISLMTPYDAKDYWLGREDAIRADWKSVRLSIMEDLVTQKFLNNAELAQLLLDTKDMILEEGNDWGDTFWGIDLSTGEGQNHLGKILMKIRQRLQK